MDLFHPDNPVIRFLARVFDLILLNLLFVITCIPIVTIGASLSAIYEILFKIIDKKDPYILKGYIKAFKENFKRATMLWIAIAVIAFGISLSIYGINMNPSLEYLQILVFIITFIVAAVAVYAFPLMSRYQCSLIQLLKNAFVLSLVNIPATVIVMVFPVGIIYFASAVNLHIAFFICIASTIGCSVTLYLMSYVLIQIFKKYEETEEKEDNEMPKNPE